MKYIYSFLRTSLFISTLELLSSFQTAMENVSSPEIPVSKDENFITVLSIDGGGIRGIIPGVLLAYLESQLQVNIQKSKLH